MFNPGSILLFLLALYLNTGTVVTSARNVKKGQFLSCKSYELIMEMQVNVLFTFEIQFGLASFYEC